MVNEDAALLNRRVTHMTPAALFSRRLHGHLKFYQTDVWVFSNIGFQAVAQIVYLVPIFLCILSFQVDSFVGEYDQVALGYFGS